MSQGSKPPQNLRAIWDEIDKVQEDSIRKCTNQNGERLMPIGSERSQSRSNISKIKFGYPDMDTSWIYNDDLASTYQEVEERRDKFAQTSSMYSEMLTLEYPLGSKQLFKRHAASDNNGLADYFEEPPMRNLNAKKDESERKERNTCFENTYHCPSNYQNVKNRDKAETSPKLVDDDKTDDYNNEDYRNRDTGRHLTSNDKKICQYKEDIERLNQRILMNVDRHKEPVKEPANQRNDNRQKKTHMDTRNYKYNGKPMGWSSENKFKETENQKTTMNSENNNSSRNRAITRNRINDGNVFPRFSHGPNSYRNIQKRGRWNSNYFNCHQENTNVKANYMKCKHYKSSSSAEQSFNSNDEAFRDKPRQPLQNALHGNKEIRLNNNECFGSSSSYSKASDGKPVSEREDKIYIKFVNNTYGRTDDNIHNLSTATSSANHTMQSVINNNQQYKRDYGTKPEIMHHFVRHEVKVIHVHNNRQRGKKNRFKNSYDENKLKEKAETNFKDCNGTKYWLKDMSTNPEDITWNIIDQKTQDEREQKEDNKLEFEEKDENRLKSEEKEDNKLDFEEKDENRLKSEEKEDNKLKSKAKMNNKLENEENENNEFESEENKKQQSVGQIQKFRRIPYKVNKISPQMFLSPLNPTSDCNSEKTYNPLNAKNEVLQTLETKTFSKTPAVDEGYAYSIDTSAPPKSSRNTPEFTNKSRQLIHFGKEITDLVCGCHKALDLFLSLYRSDWITTRLHTIEIMDNLIKEVLEKSSKESRLKNFFKYIGIGGKVGAATEIAAMGIVPKYVGVACTVVGQLAELLAKYCETSPIQFNAKEFEMMKAFQYDVDVSDDLYMYALQCDQQLQETKEVIEDFYVNVVRGEYNDVAFDLGLKDFLEQIHDFKLSHPSFHRQLYIAMKRLSVKRDDSEACEAFSFGFDEHPEEMVALKSLNWRCNVDAAGNGKLMGWEEISALLQNTTATNKAEVVKKLQDCSRVLVLEERALKQKVKLLWED